MDAEPSAPPGSTTSTLTSPQEETQESKQMAEDQTPSAMSPSSPVTDDILVDMEMDDMEYLEETAIEELEDPSLPAGTVIGTYLATVKEAVKEEIKMMGRPMCYQQGSFWINPPDPLLTTSTNVDHYYQPRVFIFIPHLILPAMKLECLKCTKKLRYFSSMKY